MLPRYVLLPIYGLYRDMSRYCIAILLNDELLLQFTVNMAATKEPKPSYHAIGKDNI